jgi:predicted unusual protein kinase regulating ubiquinone biosynthesis (AarF/ABC1/UbiB family)
VRRTSLRRWGVPQAVALSACLARIGIGRAFTGEGTARSQREARWLAATLGSLKGPFAKVGQFASLRVDLLEPEVIDALRELRDRVPALPFPRIRALVEAELGAPLEQLFASFETQPIGAASIAQVHGATLPGGRPVAVKVQYPWLRDALPADLRLLRWLLRRVVGRRRDALFDEFAAGVEEELDFGREARVAAEIAANLSGEERIVVPTVFPQLSSARVLTMDRHAALALTEPDALAARGVPMDEVMEILARAFAKMIFVDGLFHADPHPGNLLVLDEPTARTTPRVLFVDFGLSKRLAPELRGELQRGIYAVLQGDIEAFLAAMERTGMIAPGAEGNVRDAVGGMFQRLRGEAGGPLGLTSDRILGLKDEAKTLLFDTEGLTLPTELLLYARTLSYLFALGAELAPGVDLMKISVPYLLRFLAEKTPTASPAQPSAAADPGAR